MQINNDLVIATVNSGEMFTQHHINRSAPIIDLLYHVFDRLPRREFDEEWHGPTGYMDGVPRDTFEDIGLGFSSVDTYGRRMVVLPSSTGRPMAYFERALDSGRVACNGYMEDLAPSWNNGKTRVPSGYAVDNDQFAEPLLRLADPAFLEARAA